jgi:hypothetical protein
LTEVHELRSARKLGVNETTVARRLARVEALLGVRLFEREAGVLRPTNSGQIVVRGIIRQTHEVGQVEVRVHRGSGCCAREIVPEFHGIIRCRAAAELSSWIERARAILIASFLRGVTNDEAAVRAALNRKGSTHWSGARGSG